MFLKKKSPIKYDAHLLIPTTIKEINSILKELQQQKKFSIKFVIKIKGYLLDKNEKKLSKLDDYIILTEKEVQLIELF